MKTFDMNVRLKRLAFASARTCKLFHFLLTFHGMAALFDALRLFTLSNAAERLLRSAAASIHPVVMKTLSPGTDFFR